MSIFHIEYFEPGTRRTICALTLFIAWCKMFEWLKMFDTTSPFVKLIIQTITDVLPVMFLIFPVFLFTICTSMFILNTNREGEDQEI